MKKVFFTLMIATAMGACTTSQSTQTAATKAVETKQAATNKPDEPQNQPVPTQESRYKKAPNGAVKSLPMEAAPIEIVKIDSL